MSSNMYRYEYLKTQIDQLGYISKFMPLKRVGSIFKARCIFHNEKTPSMTVYPVGHMDPRTKEEQKHVSFYCFGCGVGGDVISFKQLKDNHEDRLEACIALEKEHGLALDDESVQQNFLKEQLQYIKSTRGNCLSLPEIIMVCSIMSRNYINWIKEYYPTYWEQENDYMEKYYEELDDKILDLTLAESYILIDEVEKTINDRRSIVFEHYKNTKGKG